MIPLKINIFCSYELNCMKYLFKCHDHLENWLYLESLLSLKKGNDALIMWENSHQNKEVILVSCLFMFDYTNYIFETLIIL